MYRIFLYVGLSCHLSVAALSQPSEKGLIQRLEALQVQEENLFYDKGLFPCQRQWSFMGSPVEDNTIYFTASIVASLRYHRQFLDEANRSIADRIMERASHLYGKYQSRNKRFTYNFWQTIPPDLPFPNGGKALSNEKNRLPDDYNTTALVSTALNDSAHSRRVKVQMEEYASRGNRKDTKLLTLDEYRNAKAYEVWFGRDMTQTFDICVLANILSFLFQNQYVLNNYDHATIDLVKRMIINSDYQHNLEQVAHQTNSVTMVLYHLAKMLEQDKGGHFKEEKPKFIGDIQSQLTRTENELERVMLAVSLLRLGSGRDIQIDLEALSSAVQSYQAITVNPFNVSKGVSGLWPSINWTCEAYNQLIVLEYVLLKKQSQ